MLRDGWILEEIDGRQDRPTAYHHLNTVMMDRYLFIIRVPNDSWSLNDTNSWLFEKIKYCSCRQKKANGQNLPAFRLGIHFQAGNRVWEMRKHEDVYTRWEFRITSILPV